jgi:hypothetical protein
MHLLSCDDCGKTQQTESIICPTCGGKKTMILHNICSMVSPESISFSVEVLHRTWAFLPSGIQSSLAKMPVGVVDKKTKGECLMVMISTAALVEGVYTDAIEAKLEVMLLDAEKKVFAEKQLRELNRIAWHMKKLLAEKLSWDLIVLNCFEVVELLFAIRNNLGHGRSYKIRDTRAFKNNAFRRKGPVSIANERYQRIYQKLFEKGILPPLEDNPGMSMEVFLTPAVAKFFYQDAISFLRSFLDATQVNNGYDLRPEFEQAIS